MGKSSPEQALVWADVTEFTQAMEASESSMALSTLAWVDRCVQGWLSELQGRFLQQAGDAVLLAFDDAHLALQAAHRLRRDWQSLGSQRNGEWGRDLRVALHWGPVWAGKQGYVAHSLNQLSRLASEVLPGQVWASAALWQRLPAGLQDCSTELGLMHFKHLDAPMRVFRLWPLEPPKGRAASPGPATVSAVNQAPRPRLAVQSAQGDGDWAWTQGVLEWASQDPSITVAALAPGPARGHSALATLQGTGADFLLWRSSVQGDWARVTLLAAPHGFEIEHWPVAAQDTGSGLGSEVRATWQRHAWAMAQSLPQSALSHGLLSHAAVQLMHAGQPRDFERSLGLLQAWQSRFRRSARPLVWRVLWHVMRHTRGLGGTQVQDVLQHAQRALELEPEWAHAWAARGFALGHLCGDIEAGMRDLERAEQLQADLPWCGIYRSTLCCLNGQARQGLQVAGQALTSPMVDGLTHYALGVAGHAAVFAGQATLGARWLEGSWRGHRYHSPTLRMLVVAHQMLGHTESARVFLRELLTLEPSLTVRSYLARTRVAHARRLELAHWMAQAGLPLK